MNSQSQAVPTDRALELLAVRRRREVIEHLLENDDEPVSIGDLVSGITADRSLSGSDGQDTAEIAIELHHHHLPKLADAGVVDYDRRNGTVRYRSHAAIEELLQFVSGTLE